MVHAYQSVYNNLQKIEDGYEESVRSVRKYFYVTGNVRIIFVIESNTKLLLIDDYHDLSLKKKKKNHDLSTKMPLHNHESHILLLY